jgi:lysyl-tRNA synthetase, class II
MSQPGISYSSIDTQRTLRIEKMNKLRELGQDPFTPNSQRDYTLADIKAQFEDKKSLKSITLAGRIKSKRTSGKIAFGTIEDESLPDGFQFIFKQDELPTPGNAEKLLTFADFKDLFEEGDYIQATGVLGESQRGEPSLFVHQYHILTKALRPLPESLEYDNFESRYLDRVADFKMNTKDPNGIAIRDIIKLKSKYWQIWREEMIAEGFLEVECPIFESIPGGADAKPFTTYYNLLDQEMYLRISLELPLKKLIAGGFEKVFEIGRIFRNEGSDPTHLQEYTQIEWYWAYSNYYDAMPFIARIYRKLAQEVLGKLEQVDYKGNTINWGEWITKEEAQKHGWQVYNGWPAIPYFEAIRHFSEGTLDLENKNYKELLEIAKEHSIEIEPGTSISNLIDKIYKKTARPKMVNPMFLIAQPVELEPLAKRDPQNPNLVHRWQIVAGGEELGKCFSELNDPIDQLDRFKEQQKARDAGDEEAQFMNEDYVKALEYGLPPLSGFGMSERLLPFLLGKHIRETVTFPAIRTNPNEYAKSKKTLVAHAVLLNTPEIPMWSKLNAAAHLSASFAARRGKELIHLDKSVTKDGDVIPMNIQHAIVMKQVSNKADLLDLKKAATEMGLDVSVFTEEMRESSNDEKVQNLIENKTSYETGYLGVLVFGKKSDVEEVTDHLSLLE